MKRNIYLYPDNAWYYIYFIIIGGYNGNWCSMWNVKL